MTVVEDGFGTDVHGVAPPRNPLRRTLCLPSTLPFASLSLLPSVSRLRLSYPTFPPPRLFPLPPLTFVLSPLGFPLWSLSRRGWTGRTARVYE